MENAANIRSQPVVAALDTSNVFEEVGLKVSEPAMLAKAQGVVAALVKDADAQIDSHFAKLEALPQNPYAERAILDGRELQHAAIVRLFAGNHLYGLVNEAFGEHGENVVDLTRLTDQAIVALKKHLEEHGFELAAVERHARGRGIAAVALRDPVYVGKALAAQAASSDEAIKLRGDIGFRTPCSTVELKAARAVVDDFCSEALARVERYVQTTSVAGGSPFGEASPSLQRDCSVIADSRRVKDGYHNVVPAGAVVVIGRSSQLLSRLTDRVGPNASIDKAVFLPFLLQNLAERLRARPDLMGALVGYERSTDASHGFHYSEDQVLQVICAPEPPPPPAPPPPQPSAFAAFLARIVAYLPSFKRDRPALPPPTEAPKQLPAPAAEVVPPVTTGPYASK